MHSKDACIFERNPSGVTEILSRFRVGIAGCGGIGSNCALALARSGIGGLVLVDYDRVELSNLNRQQFSRGDVGALKAEALLDAIRSIRQDIDLTVHANTMVTETNVVDLFCDCRIVIEACDAVESKCAIMRAFMDDAFRDSWLIGVSGIGGMGLSEKIQPHRMGRNIYVCGDLESDVEKDGVMAARVLLAAACQVNLAIRLLCGLETND